MKIATWNINSLKVRLLHVLDWLKLNPVDVLCLQEIKLSDDCYPHAAIEAAGYHSFCAGQKTYNGVAILVKHGHQVAAHDVVRNIPGFEDPQKRLIALTVGGLRIICAYFPNGQAPGSDKFAYKLRWIDALADWLAGELLRCPKLALIGDFNIAPEDRDVHDPSAWQGQNLVSPPERAGFIKLVELGLIDAFRCFEQPVKTFTWWDYRRLGFRRNAGLRIDHILLTPPLADICAACAVDKTPRGWSQPSDHAPVVAEFSDQQTGTRNQI